MNPISSYPFRLCNCSEGNHPVLKNHIYSFYGKNNHGYIVKVEEYSDDFFFLKFHLKSHSNSRKKYILLTKINDARRVIYTCLKIGQDILSKNNNASFGFIGSPTEKELTREDKLLKTKRFNVYSKFANFHFSPDSFHHSFNSRYSTYLLINTKSCSDPEEKIKKIQKMISDSYNVEDLFNFD